MKVEYICKECDHNRMYKKRRPKVSAKAGTYPVLSGFIRMRRMELKIKQRDLGKILGLLPSGMTSIEQGKVGVRTTHLPTIAEALQVDLRTIVDMAELDRFIAAKGAR
jgi:transcriptional regulator with XRE-family HTH domain